MAERVKSPAERRTSTDLRSQLFINRRLCSEAADPSSRAFHRSTRKSRLVAFGAARSRPLETLNLDQAPGTVRILGHEARQPRRRGQLVQQPSRQPPVQRADDGLVLADGLTIGTVAEPKGDASLRRLALGSETQRGQRSAHRL